jgi:hypothetical protein
MASEKDSFLYTKVNVKRILPDKSGAEVVYERALVFETTYYKEGCIIPMILTKEEQHIADFADIMSRFKLTMVSKLNSVQSNSLKRHF